jgi:hypothetical protein
MTFDLAINLIAGIRRVQSGGSKTKNCVVTHLSINLSNRDYQSDSIQEIVN